MRYVLIVFGIALGIAAIQERQLASLAKAKPQTITCAQLGNQGAGDNAHVNMTDFFLCTSHYVIQGDNESEIWSKVWIPAVPRDGEYVNSSEPGPVPTESARGSRPCPRTFA